jgi:hypothetical protein
LRRQLVEGDNVVRRLSKIAIAARSPSEAEEAPVVESAATPASAPARVSGAKAVAAAAQAFSERRRAGGLAA